MRVTFAVAEPPVIQPHNPIKKSLCIQARNIGFATMPAEDLPTQHVRTRYEGPAFLPALGKVVDTEQLTCQTQSEFDRHTKPLIYAEALQSRAAFEQCRIIRTRRFVFCRSH